MPKRELLDLSRAAPSSFLLWLRGAAISVEAWGDADDEIEDLGSIPPAIEPDDGRVDGVEIDVDDGEGDGELVEGDS